MKLEEYKKKRDFSKTPEPTGGTPTGDKLHFVIQKHRASHLHYDFRIELHGVLKSWAVPKGLSMNPGIRRLAMHVEDHPWDYRNFEGIIPSGYGKGTVMVWDEGWYESGHEDIEPDKKSQEHSISSQYWKGAIKFTLHGEKVKGTFAIYKDKSKDDNSWYIQKMEDEFVTEEDINLKDKSVISGKTLKEIAANPAREWTSKSEEQMEEIRELVTKGSREDFPKKVAPMNCMLIKKPFDDVDWIYELKLDGYRVIAFVDGKNVKLRSRSGLDYTKKFSAVADAFKELDLHAVIDGEMTYTGEDGTPDFDALQAYSGKGPLLYYAFDILWKDGYNLEELGLLSRKKILKETLPTSDVIEYTGFFEQGVALFDEIEKRGLEGIVAKRKNSIYRQGKRSDDWLKLPTENRQEFVIGGWVESEAGQPFKTLVFGAYKNGELNYIGHSGSGFTNKEQKEVSQKLKDIASAKNPFKEKPDIKGKIHYVKPILIATFKYATFTASGKIRKPAVFKGFRDDKKPEDVIFEIPLTAAQEKQVIEKDEVPLIHTSEGEKGKNQKEPEHEESNWRYLLNEEITSSGEVTLNGKQVKLTNIEREIWKGIPKASLIQYYNQMTPYLLPHIKDRPQSLHIKNINAGAPGFYIKDMEEHQPEWAKIFTVKRKHPKKGKSELINYFVCNDEAALIYLINLGCVDINPWTSRTANYREPDFVIIDLDPTDDDFGKVVKTALAAKKVFDVLKLKTFPKTSGKTGMHIYIPCAEISFPEARRIATHLSSLIHQELPDITTTANTISERGDKVFIDYNQNDEADTVAAPYSVRPSSKPTVSAPLEWKEVNQRLKLDRFTMENIAARVEKKGDLFEGVLDKKTASQNSKILRKLMLR